MAPEKISRLSPETKLAQLDWHRCLTDGRDLLQLIRPGRKKIEGLLSYLGFNERFGLEQNEVSLATTQTFIELTLGVNEAVLDIFYQNKDKKEFKKGLDAKTIFLLFYFTDITYKELIEDYGGNKTQINTIVFNQCRKIRYVLSKFPVGWSQSEEFFPPGKKNFFMVKGCQPTPVWEIVNDPISYYAHFELVFGTDGQKHLIFGFPEKKQKPMGNSHGWFQKHGYIALRSIMQDLRAREAQLLPGDRLGQGFDPLLIELIENAGITLYGKDEGYHFISPDEVQIVIYILMHKWIVSGSR